MNNLLEVTLGQWSQDQNRDATPLCFEFLLSVLASFERSLRSDRWSQPSEARPASWACDTYILGPHT